MRPVAAHATTSAAPTSSALSTISFRNHVLPVLTKVGCNSGACHGAAAGKNGFALTLRGYDPEADYETSPARPAGAASTDSRRPRA